LETGVSDSLDIFGCTRRATDAVRLRFAQVPEPCQERGKVGSVKQSLLAELDAFEVMSVAAFFDGPLRKDFDGLPTSASRAL